MPESTLLRQIMEANKSFLAGAPRMLDPAGDPFVVVACIDPRLTGFLEPALGLPRHRAVVIRTAGNQFSAGTPDAMRSVAVALYVKNATEIIVVGHTDCGLSNFSVAAVTDNFRKAGIPRTAFGDQDLRCWFGAFANVRENILSSIEYLRKSGIVARAIKAHGLLFDTDRGSIEVVVDADVVREPVALPVIPTAVEEPHAAAEIQEKEPESAPAKVSQAAPGTPPGPAARKGPIVVGEPLTRTAPQPPDSLLEAALVLRDFFHRERASQQMQKAIADLRLLWRQEKSPYQIYAQLQKIGHAYQDQYPGLPGALAYLQSAIKSGSAEKFGFGELLRRILD
jgi:carbonic anhydrase